MLRHLCSLQHNEFNMGRRIAEEDMQKALPLVAYNFEIDLILN